MEPVEKKPFINTAVLYGAVIALVSTIVIYGAILGAMSGESANIGFLAVICFGCCIFAVLPGILANRAYITDIKMPIELGTGALIGVIAGIAYGVTSFLLDTIMYITGIDANQLFMEFMILFLESFDMPEMDNAIEDIRDQMGAQSVGARIGNFFMSVIVSGLLNVLSGLASASIFSNKYKKNTF